MNKIVNFFEWGIACKEFNSKEANGVQPIYAFSFEWNTELPEIFTFSGFEHAGIVSGIGQYNFEMPSTIHQAKIQEIFKRQKKIPELSFIRFVNQNGNIVEKERYTVRQAYVGKYHLNSRSNENIQRFSISIYGTGEDEYVQTVWEEDMIIGKVVAKIGNFQDIKLP